MLRPLIAFSLLLALALMPLSSSPLQAAGHRAQAKLYGSAVFRGQAKYHEVSRQGNRDQRFNVRVTRQAPFKIVPVRVNGRKAGVMVTNAAGMGRLNLRTNGLGAADPLPPNFPRLRTGHVVAAGRMVGIVFDTTGGSYQVGGEASGADGTVTCVYMEQSGGPDTTLERRFEAHITGGIPSHDIPIFINDVFFGTVTTDEFGNGSFEMSSPGLNDGDDWQIPAEFPSLKAGDQVRVGNTFVTMSKAPGNGGGGGHHDDDSSDDDSSDDDSSDDDSSDDDSSDDDSSDDDSSDDDSSDDDSSDDDDHSSD